MDEGTDESLASRLDALASQIGITSDEPGRPRPVAPASSEASLAEVWSSMEERMAVLEDSLQNVGERIESLARDGISVTGEGIERLAEGVRSLDKRLGDLSASGASSYVADNGNAALIEALSAAMGQALTDLADAVGESLRAQGHSVTAALAETRNVAPQLTQAEVVEAVRTTLAEAPAPVVAPAEPQLTSDEVRAAVSSSLDEAMGKLTETLEAALQSQAQAVTSALTETAVAIGSISLEPVGEAPLTRAEMAEALGEIAVRLLEGQEVIADRVEFVQTHLANEAHRRDDQHAQLSHALSTTASAAADADEVVVAEIMRTADSLGGVFAELQGQRNLLVALVDEVRRSINRVDGALGGVAGSLVRYLADRDRLLEAERAQIEREMLSRFAEGLKAPDRKRAAQRISAALDQRADARDAQRWRDAVTDPVAASDITEDDVATLHDLLDRFDDRERLVEALPSEEELLKEPTAAEPAPAAKAEGTPPATKATRKPAAQAAPKPRAARSRSARKPSE